MKKLTKEEYKQALLKKLAIKPTKHGKYLINVH